MEREGTRAWGAFLQALEFVPKVWKVPGARALGSREAALRLQGRRERRERGWAQLEPSTPATERQQLQG